MHRSKYFYFAVLVLGWLFFMEARGAGGVVVTTRNEEPLPESIRDNPGAYRAQLAARARARAGK